MCVCACPSRTYRCPDGHHPNFSYTKTIPENATIVANGSESGAERRDAPSLPVCDATSAATRGDQLQGWGEASAEDGSQAGHGYTGTYSSTAVGIPIR